ncbi:hypothetical protein MtrunA17_Chr3g0092821 [Medicago truncatula]|uniref:Uncharacterized protein n=1 Tax=Medicago truncatula TaxID=3880 RepID=A0A396ILU3_MEDTR|nr:hypothetical protein MtrunA17_Chr3g0092821 [Medicago truncatula]
MLSLLLWLFSCSRNSAVCIFFFNIALIFLTDIFICYEKISILHAQFNTKLS